MSECGIASGLVGRRNLLPEVFKKGVHSKEIVDGTQGDNSDGKFRRNLVMIARRNRDGWTG
jgi:hypothetical protein